jgi:hypothetical protein
MKVKGEGFLSGSSGGNFEGRYLIEKHNSPRRGMLFMAMIGDRFLFQKVTVCRTIGDIFLSLAAP